MNKGKVCISICARTANELIEKIGRAATLADVVEIRFDCLNPADVLVVLENFPDSPSTFLLTYRPSEQGGLRVLPVSARLVFWKQALDALAGRDILVDLEADINFPLRINERNVVRSIHFFNSPPRDLQPAFFELADLGDGIVKIAATASDITDTLPVWKLLEIAEREDRALVPIAMGEAGKWTRILGPAYGAFMTYAALDEAEATAPGQATAADLTEVYRVKELSRSTKVHGIIAGNTTYSTSPWMHNAGFKADGEDRVFVPLQVSDLDAFMRRMVRPETREVDLNFAGFSVTNPHKQTIIEHLDELDDTAQKIGAVNTVQIKDEKLTGYNTDALGFIVPLKEVFGTLNGARVAVVGAGGAARAVIYALTQENADVTVFARDTSKAASLAESFKISVAEVPETYAGFDIVVNCTPLGTSGDTADQTIAIADQLMGVKLVYDLVYNPTDTLLIREAKKAGVQTLGGLEMLIAQGAEQFRIWTERDAPLEAMRSAVKKKLGL